MSEAIRAAYRRGEDDEDMGPLVRVDRAGQPVGRIGHGDYVIFYDIRGEREIELTESFTDPNFRAFPVEPDIRTHWATMIQYDPKLDVRVAFPPEEEITDTLSEVVSRHGLRQVKISESEKAIHVNFFLNGKRKEPFPGEQRIVVPTPEDGGPEMGAAQVADAIIEQIRRGDDHFLVGNFANVDVLGHIESKAAILQAVHVVDTEVGRVVREAERYEVPALIVSDHGTVEKWLYPEGTVDTGHTDSPVHSILVTPSMPVWEGVALKSGGSLTDVAPTVLHLLGLPKPGSMTGESLLLGYTGGKTRETPRRVLLLITDGWGHRDETYGNLIAEAETPMMDRLNAVYPHTLLQAAGEAVGLPPGTVGNSEAGHLHIGAGRVIYSDRVRIQRAIGDGSFFQNPAFLWAMRGAQRDGTALHLLGIISFFSSHGSVDYLLALMRMAKQEELRRVFIHALLGRRGERPESGARYVWKVEEEAGRRGVGQVASMIGRFWALDREENWDRIEKTYRMLVYGEGHPVSPEDRRLP